MTDHARAIEAGARAIHIVENSDDYPFESVAPDTYRKFAKACIEAAIASGELVPATAVAAERERCAALIRSWTNHSKMQLHAGEMTAQEKRTTEAVLNAIERQVSALPAPASGKFVVVPAKPIGWFNPWNEYHGFQQVAEEFEGGPDTIPLYADQKTHDDLKTAMLNAATKDGERK